MNFDVFFASTKNGETKPGIAPKNMAWEEVKKVMAQKSVADTIAKIRATKDKAVQQELKKHLPAICWHGTCVEGKTRAAASVIPTQLVMIDIDHPKIDPEEIWGQLKERIGNVVDLVMVAHATPRRGLRVVFMAQEGLGTIEENQKWFEQYVNPEWGDYDTAVKDFSRISFLTKEDEILFENARLYLNDATLPGKLVNASLKTGEPAADIKEAQGTGAQGVPGISEEEKAQYEALDYKGAKVTEIIRRYEEVYGEPSSGELHNRYNEMVKNFRNLTSNNKKALLYLLPRYGHSAEECWSQIKSICKVNTTTTLPRDFYFFMKDNGYYKPRETQEDKALREYMLKEGDNEQELGIPYLPPIIRDIVNTAPKDFVVPVINALMPVIGTLTSYVQAIYPYDNDMHSTTFFSIIYAPAGTGKSFCKRFSEMLLSGLRKRDRVQTLRSNLYETALNRKGANEKAPEEPRTSLRYMPAKNSETRLLQKMSNNGGYHMFTYAAEMDEWAKGSKAAGGSKDDLIRIAWDNGIYGQQYKSTNTFNGEVKLFWNVLITGTLPQVLRYFQNVENGLVTRCSFTPIENQEFVLAPRWKKLSEKSMAAIEKFMKKCDENSYEKPLDVDINELASLSLEDFDNEVEWQYKFKPKQTVDMEWIMPTIDAFQVDEVAKASKDVDNARDVFRRRVGVRGFRLALMCTCLYTNMRAKDKENVAKFVKWWMEQDLENMIKLWGQKYNESTEVRPNLSQRSVFSELPDEFEKADVYAVCVRQGIKSPVKAIIYSWKRMGFVEKVGNNKYRKIKQGGKK